MPILRISVTLCLLIVADITLAFTANKVWFEFQPNGGYKVIVNYTVPELKEFREAYVVFYNKKSAEKFYWSLVRGADFYPAEPYKLEYQAPKLRPDPW